MYYNCLKDFLDYARHPFNTLYIRASVTLPLRVISNAFVRCLIYDFFRFNTPPEIYHCINGNLKFRIFFLSTNTIEDEVVIDRISWDTNYTTPFYYNLYCEQSTALQKLKIKTPLTSSLSIYCCRHFQYAKFFLFPVTYAILDMQMSKSCNLIGREPATS